MKLNEKEIFDFLNTLNERDFSFLSHRIFGNPEPKYIKNNILRLYRQPLADLGIWQHNDAFLIGCSRNSNINSKIFYGELYWVNFGQNSFDAVAVFKQAVNYAKWKGYDGFLYSKLNRDYQFNELKNFDHSTYGLVF